jgi:hypothetical protein
VGERGWVFFKTRKGIPVEDAGLAVVGLLLQCLQLNAKSGVRDRGLALQRKVELALLLQTRATVALA